MLPLWGKLFDHKFMIEVQMVLCSDKLEMSCVHISFSVLSLCPRACNSVADKLAAHGASVVSPGSCIFMCHIPDFVLDLVSGDMPRARE